MIYFTADLHFGHKRIIESTQRSFNSVEEMDAALITNWNSRITEKDEVYILGDITMKKQPEYVMDILNRLNGRKYLVRGNHDHFVDKAEFDQSLFEWVKDYHVMSYEKMKFVLFHYPIHEWDQSHRGSVHLHGHQHNKSDYNTKNAQNGLLRYDVGVEVNNYAPVSIQKIISLFAL